LAAALVAGALVAGALAVAVDFAAGFVVEAFAVVFLAAVAI
jgi:hypothetical protein